MSSIYQSQISTAVGIILCVAAGVFADDASYPASDAEFAERAFAAAFVEALGRAEVAGCTVQIIEKTPLLPPVRKGLVAALLEIPATVTRDERPGALILSVTQINASLRTENRGVRVLGTERLIRHVRGGFLLRLNGAAGDIEWTELVTARSEDAVAFGLSDRLATPDVIYRTPLPPRSRLFQGLVASGTIAAAFLIAL